MKKVDTFQRKGSISNAHVGRAFENLAQQYLLNNGIIVENNFKLNIGINNNKKVHAFDLGNNDDKIIVECKSHKWTKGENVPSAKMTVWNEAMLYFFLAPNDFQKKLIVLYDYSKKRKETLAEYYIRTYYHLIPSDVEIIELSEDLSVLNIVRGIKT